MAKNNSLLRSSLQITLLSILTVTVNFILQLVIAYYYGTSYERDCYLAAIVIPTYLNAVIVGSLGFIFLPKFQEIQNNNSKVQLNSFLCNTFIYLFIFLSIIIFIGIILSESIIRSSVPGFNQEQMKLTTKLLIIILPTSMLFIFNNLFSSILQVRSNFVKPALVQVVVPFVSILSVVLFATKYGIFSLAIGFLIGNIISTTFLMISVRDFNFRLSFIKIDQNVLSMIRMTAPLFFLGFLFRFTPVFERMIASDLPEGSISYLGYSSQILSILVTITTSGIAVSFFPLMSKYWIEKKFDDVSNLLIMAIRIVLLMTIPIATVIIFFGQTVIKIFLERGAFDHNSTIAVTLSLTMMMGAFIAQSIGNITAKVFYFSGRTWAISIIALFELLIYVILGFYLSNLFLYIGLAAAISISSLFNIFVSLVFLKKKVFNIEFTKLLIDLGKIIISSAIAAFFAWIINKLGFINEIFDFVLSMFVFGLLFYFVGLILSIHEFIKIRNLILTRFLLVRK